jgi:cyclophilin family peptidyl-prolyl cis-trans isomerase
MNYKWILLGLGILLILLLIYKKRSSILNFLKPACPYVQSKKEEDFQPSIRPPDPNYELDNKKEYIVLSISKSPEENKEVKIGDIYISLYENMVPKTCHNFKSLSKIEYKNCVIHRLIKGFMLQTGDYEKSNGTGGISVYGKKFPDENFNIKHTKRGLLSMANSGPDTNGSQFFITFDAAPHLDGKHVVFGEVVKGWEVLDAIEAMKTNEKDEPNELLYISNTKITNHL